MKVALHKGRVPGSVDALVYEIAGTNVCILVVGYHLLMWITAAGPYPVGIFYPATRMCA